MVSRQMLDFWAVSPGMPEIPPIQDLPAARKQGNARMMATYPILPGVKTEAVICDGVSAVWYRPPTTKANRAILYIHGGAFIWGSGESHCGVISRVAAECGCDALALDYGLAPEHPFPGPVHEGVRLYKWMLSAGYHPDSISLVGDSAGGGLVLSVIVALKAEGVALPACAAIASAYADLTNTGETIDWVTKDPCVTREGLDACRAQYLQGHDPKDPLASPIFADLTGFPPVLVQVGSRERLMSDSTRFAAKADAAGVDVTLEVYDGCVHLWHWWVPDAPETAATIKSIGAFVALHTLKWAPV
jgi:epsilon-lactone hydrolase